MYLEHFGLGVNPFGLSPKLDFLYKSGTFEESMAHLVYGLDNQEAIVMITGAIGTGKTMALQSFLTHLGSRFEFALVTNTRVTSVELLKLVLEDLGVDLQPGLDKSDLLIMFKDHLLRASRDGKKVLIVVDEAQGLAADVLEEIRLLTNLGQGDGQPVQIILVGQPELEAAVNRPDLAQLRQRIRVHYRLDPLSRAETSEYIHHRMKVAGADREIFTSGALDAIYHFSRGVPRLVNTMAGDALLAAFVAGHRQVQAGDVEKDRELAFESGPTPASAPSDPLAPAGASFEEAPRRENLARAEDVIDAMPGPPPERPSRPEPEPAPVHEPEPVRAAAPPPEPEPEVFIPPRGDRRQGDRRHGARGRWWAVAAVVVAAVAALWYFGYLDGMMTILERTGQAGGASRPSVAEQVSALEDKVDEVAGMETDEAPARASETESAREEPESGSDTASSEPPAEERPVPVSEKSPAAATETPDAAPATAAGAGEIFIHVASFKTPARAQSLVNRMHGEVPGAVYLKRRVRDTDWYRVYLGPYGTTADAHMDGLRYKQDGTITFYRITRIDPNDRS